MRAAILFVLAFSVLTLASPGASAQTGRVVGTVTEAGTDNTLPGANVVVQGTTIGAATDLNGRYILTGVPAGPQTIVASFVGYDNVEREVVIPAGEEITVDLELLWAAAQTEGVTVTAQARGQIQAINEQLSAQTIKNVVSAERIRELPDESAAAAVSRLPGVSLQEGDKIVVRGIQAKLNTITVNGIQLPSTDLEDRSTNLGFISSNMLAGIEVTKAVTPAMDANSIGGSVNLRLREAPQGWHYDAMLQGDYNGQDHTYANYRAWGSVSNRFFGDRLGAFVQANARRFDGGQDVGTATYAPLASDPGSGLRPFAISEYQFADQANLNEEYGGSALFDFRLPGGKIIFQNTFATEAYDNTSYVERLLLVNGNRGFRLERNVGERYLLVNALQGEHLLGRLGIDWTLSHARSQNDTDLNYAIDFSNAKYFEGQPLANWQSEEDVFAITFDQEGLAASTAGNGATRDESYSERRLNAALNLTLPVTLPQVLSGSFQAGGKVEQLARNNDITRYFKRLSEPSNNEYAADFIESIGGDPTQALRFEDFRDPDYERGEYFLGDRRSLTDVANVEYLDQYFRLAPQGWPLPHFADSYRFDYVAEEQVAAAYLMGDFDITDYVNVLGGVRYEKFSVDNEAPFVYQNHFDGAGAVFDTLSTERNLAHWFPNVQLRISPLDWVDLRLAYTKTLSRPDYQLMLPSTFVNGDGGTGIAGNPLLEPTVSDNFDAYLSFHNNYIGLFTVGAFSKDLEDVILTQRILRSTLGEFEGVYWAPAQLPVNEDGDPVDAEGNEIPDLRSNQTLTTYLNNPYPGRIRGLEFDWQTNFWYLPGALKSVVFNINYTRVHSEMDYRQILQVRANPLAPPTQVDTFRTARLLQQGNDILNFALGADIGGFSGRLSFRYQGDVITNVSELRPEEDTYCLLYTSPSPRDRQKSRMPSSA